MKTDPAIVQHYLRSLQQPRHELSNWELEFLADVSDQFANTVELSDGQIKKLYEIYKAKA